MFDVQVHFWQKLIIFVGFMEGGHNAPPTLKISKKSPRLVGLRGEGGSEVNFFKFPSFDICCSPGYGGPGAFYRIEKKIRC